MDEQIGHIAVKHGERWAFDPHFSQQDKWKNLLADTVGVLEKPVYEVDDKLQHTATENGHYYTLRYNDTLAEDQHAVVAHFDQPVSKDLIPELEKTLREFPIPEGEGPVPAAQLSINGKGIVRKIEYMKEGGAVSGAGKTAASPAATLGASDAMHDTQSGESVAARAEKSVKAARSWSRGKIAAVGVLIVGAVAAAWALLHSKARSDQAKQNDAAGPAAEDAAAPVPAVQEKEKSWAAGVERQPAQAAAGR